MLGLLANSETGKRREAPRGADPRQGAGITDINPHSSLPGRELTTLTLTLASQDGNNRV